MTQGREPHLGRARIAASRSITSTWVRPANFPSEQEIRHELHRQAQWLATSSSGETCDASEDAAAEADAVAASDDAGRFAHYRGLLEPLAHVLQPRDRHPEGDALYHSLQVFELAREASPWDEELLLAALLHDVGKAIDPRRHVESGLAALGETITSRTAWLIENHLDAQRLHEGTLGVRAQRRLREHEDFDSLLLLARCDREGRVPGARVPTIESALTAIRELAELCGE